MDVSSANLMSVAAAQRTMRTEQTQQTEQRRAEQQQSEVKAANQPQPGPVINTQGQATGRLLNVTA